MKLMDLHVQGFRGAPDGAWSLRSSAGAPLDLVVIGGGAASGKTSLLLAIAFLKEGAAAGGRGPDYESCVRAGEVEGRIAGTWLLTEDECRAAGVSDPVQRVEIGLGRCALPRPPDGLQRLFRSYSHGSRLGKLELFPFGRSLGLYGPSRASTPRSSELQEGRLRTSRRDDKYADLVLWLIQSARRDAEIVFSRVAANGVVLAADVPDSLAAFRRGVAALAPHLRYEGLELRTPTPTLGFLRSDGRRILLHDLSDTEQDAVLFSAAFARVGLHRSIVLVDAPERSVETSKQAVFVRALASLGKDNQLVVATSSSSIIDEVRPEQLVLLGSTPAAISASV